MKSNLSSLCTRIRLISFLPKHVQIPKGFQTDTFVVEPLTEFHVALDYEAVVESRDFLQRWSQSTWPTIDFTIEENLDDLVRHEREHISNEAFTYTIQNITKDECLGCIYIVPLFSEMEKAHPEIIAAKYPVQVRYWVRSTYMNTSLEREMTQKLIDWIKIAWFFDYILFCTSPKCPEQIDLFTTLGFQKQLEVEITYQRTGTWLFYN